MDTVTLLGEGRRLDDLSDCYDGASRQTSAAEMTFQATGPRRWCEQGYPSIKPEAGRLVSTFLGTPRRWTAVR